MSIARFDIIHFDEDPCSPSKMSGPLTARIDFRRWEDPT